MWVAYDEQRLRRLIKFLLRRTMIRLRVLSAFFAALGIVLLIVASRPVLPIAVIVGAVVLATLVEPWAVRLSVRAQPSVVREGYQLTLDDNGIAMKSGVYDSRMAWSTLDRVEERPEAWYLMFGQAQALAVYKDQMTPQQREQFAGFIAQRQSDFRS